MFCCAARVLKRDPITFLALNVLRLFGLIACILVIAAELQRMIDDIAAFNTRHTAAPIQSTVPTMTSFASLADTTPSIVPNLNGPQVIHGLRPRHTAGAKSHRRDTAIIRGESLSDSSCGYILDSSVPDQTGGIVFAVSTEVVNCFLLFLIFMTELPIAVISRFIDRWTPMLGSSQGLGWLGGLELYMACNILSRRLDLFGIVAGWLLLVAGGLNVLFGIMYGPAARQMRSTQASDNSPFRKVSSCFQTECRNEHAGDTDGSAPRKVVNISAPITSQSAPPYQAGVMMERGGAGAGVRPRGS